MTHAHLDPIEVVMHGVTYKLPDSLEHLVLEHFAKSISPMLIYHACLVKGALTSTFKTATTHCSTSRDSK